MNKSTLINELKNQSISVGIMASDWLNFRDTLNILLQHNLKLLHFDIADGQFSPMFTFGATVIKPFNSRFLKDVHLMVKDQFTVTKECAKLGANIITLQVETDENLTNIYQWLNKEHPNILCGISICPNTDLELITPYLSQVDVIQVLTLDPRTKAKAETGFVIDRIQLLLDKLGKKRTNKLISVDGSMNLALAEELFKLDIDWVVSGSAIFSQQDINSTLIQWKKHLT
ncbi:ribulose phosphate epimerase [Phocoenobacter skyensis]|uniref:Ribulose phosphate epimerase n=1 Tax=Phocoenobacter skyensis TaxID=97481 RepID=A0A1H7UXU8_9PAST|nr:ribulose phosphate epimerase [Pasteurella skyensis]MDP8078542.1 ribulose phosphate epimerase [Pasteurella skyensis]MDP8084366.1 ribulose phosphate epimerase [Pasteurella skyensis]MDP8171320.1 ribulose phosphate epimerase [Pasteurella skyensis]MDP8175539.1 ribulose phosphate epimerase [Pasteurella skyensis]MDP8184697.1 ribulose phosphate epimerase [Pasteurella skyensis]